MWTGRQGPRGDVETRTFSLPPTQAKPDGLGPFAPEVERACEGHRCTASGSITLNRAEPQVSRWWGVLAGGEIAGEFLTSLRFDLLPPPLHFLKKPLTVALDILQGDLADQSGYRVQV